MTGNVVVVVAGTPEVGCELCMELRNATEDFHVGLATWEQNHNGAWIPIEKYAPPFPWDPHKLTPVIDLAGCAIRVTITAVDESEKPVGQVSSEPVTVSLGPRLKEVIKKASETPRFGFHAASVVDSTRYVVLLEREGDCGVMEIRAVPDKDNEKMATVLRRVLPQHSCCSLGLEDEVTLFLSGTAGEEAFPVCLASRKERDMVAGSLRAWQAARGPFNEAQDYLSQLRTQLKV